MKQSKKYIIIFKKNSKWFKKSEKHNTTHCKEIINHQQTRGHTSTTPSTTAQHTLTEEQRHEVYIIGGIAGDTDYTVIENWESSCKISSTGTTSNNYIGSVAGYVYSTHPSHIVSGQAMWGVTWWTDQEAQWLQTHLSSPH